MAAPFFVVHGFAASVSSLELKTANSRTDGSSLVVIFGGVFCVLVYSIRHGLSNFAVSVT